MENINVPTPENWAWIASEKRDEESPPRIIFLDNAYRCLVVGRNTILVERKSTDAFGVESWVIVERDEHGYSHLGRVVLRMRDKAKGVGSEPLQIEKEVK